MTTVTVFLKNNIHALYLIPYLSVSSTHLHVPVAIFLLQPVLT
jgi:hypothetical protein